MEFNPNFTYVLCVPRTFVEVQHSVVKIMIFNTSLQSVSQMLIALEYLHVVLLWNGLLRLTLFILH
jgi:hypothetical protein